MTEEFNLKEKRKELFNAYRKRGVPSRLFNAYRKRGVPSSLFHLIKSQDKEFIKRLIEKDADVIIDFMNGKINIEDLNAKIMENKYILGGEALVK